MSTDVRLQLSGLTKQFGPTVVLDHVSLEVRAGEVHGLIGQNGAGKSTLVKTLAGLYPDHDGTVTVDGEQAGLNNPRQARAEGIAVIYQEFSLVPEMSIAENLLLGREPGLWRYSERAIRKQAQSLVDTVGIEIGQSVDASVSGLSPAVRQRVEIVKALAQDIKILIMDEPTARLSEAERRSLFRVVRELADRGVGLVFISHFLDEVRDVTDWLTVMRNGRVVASERTKSLSVGQMAALMLGEDFQQFLQGERETRHAGDAGEIVLQAESIGSGDRLRGVDISLRAGEIVGVAGLVGSGRTRLCRLLSGVEQPTSGRIRVRGRDVKLSSPRKAIANGIVLIPEDRKYQALSMTSPLSENLSLMALYRRLGRLGVVRRRSVRQLSERLVRELEVSPSNIDALAGTLSGGNQQKVVLGKAFAAAPSVFIIDQPTAGVDVGTKAQIHRLLRERADNGAAILVVSDDIDELYAVSDRFHVMRRGEVIWQGAVAEVSRDDLVELISSGGTSAPPSS
jgi:ABC-type sugar transport system ATPase subunit